MTSGPRTATCSRVPTAPNSTVPSRPRRARAGEEGAATPRPAGCQADHQALQMPAHPAEVSGRVATCGRPLPNSDRVPITKTTTRTAARVPLRLRRRGAGPSGWGGATTRPSASTSEPSKRSGRGLGMRPWCSSSVRTSSTRDRTNSRRRALPRTCSERRSRSPMRRWCWTADRARRSWAGWRVAALRARSTGRASPTLPWRASVTASPRAQKAASGTIHSRVYQR